MGAGGTGGWRTRSAGVDWRRTQRSRRHEEYWSMEPGIALRLDSHTAAGQGFLKGRFEYAVDAVPIFLVFQPTNTAYGVGFNPVDLKWDFATRGRATPYLEIDGGTLFTNHNVPSGTNYRDFTSSGVFGVHLLGPRYPSPSFSRSSSSSTTSIFPWRNSAMARSMASKPRSSACASAASGLLPR